MKVYLISFAIIWSLVSCGQESKSKETTGTSYNSDEMVSKAIADAKKLEEEALKKAKALEKQALEEVARKQREQQASKAVQSSQKNHTPSIVPNPDLSKYNGFYLNDFNNEGAFVFIDGNLFHFNCSRFKTTFKDEHYLVKDMTEEQYFNIVGKFLKDRKGIVSMKETVLSKDVMPEMKGDRCVKLKRRGRNFVRIASFHDYLNTKTHYPLEKFLADFSSKYPNRSEVEINEALSFSEFYLADFFQQSPYFSEGIPLTNILESIIVYQD